VESDTYEVTLNNHHTAGEIRPPDPCKTKKLVDQAPAALTWGLSVLSTLKKRIRKDKLHRTRAGSMTLHSIMSFIRAFFKLVFQQSLAVTSTLVQRPPLPD